MKYVSTLAVVAASLLVASCHNSPANPAATMPAATQRTKPPAEPKGPLVQFIEHPIHFESTCFRGEKFPQCDFEKPDEVRSLIGPYTLKAAFYDAAGRPVESAQSPGRYAAVVEIAYAARTSHRFITLCRLPGPPADPAATTTQPSELLHAGIDPDVLKAHASELPQRRAFPWSLYRPWQSVDAIFAASLFDLTALKKSGGALPKDSLLDLDRQWWVTFKRHYYGYDKLYANAFVCPRPVAGSPARTVHEGTLSQAGMIPDTLSRLDAECETWVKDAREGFSLCIVRHGVIVAHKAYGLQTRRGIQGAPFTIDTVGPLDSTTKIFSAILLAEFADQGLVNIDDPINKYLPTLRGLPNPSVPTIRNLYLHNAGFTDHWGDSLNDLEEAIADIYPTLHADATHKYQGTGHAVGGKIMEMISGDSVPRLFQEHLFEPLGCNNMHSDFSSYGAVGTSAELARIGQMMLNGGAYGNLRFTSPKIIAQMQPIPGRDRFDPDKTIRWGVGIKMFDSDNFSEKAYGASGSCGSFLKIDPTYDLVITMVRDNEGDRYLKHRGSLVKTVISCIEPGK